MSSKPKPPDIPWVDPGLKDSKGKPLEWELPESTNIKAYAYDKWEKKLYVAFRKNLVYSYTPISKDLFKGLKESTSKGSYFTNSIRNVPGITVYDFRKGGIF